MRFAVFGKAVGVFFVGVDEFARGVGIEGVRLHQVGERFGVQRGRKCPVFGVFVARFFEFFQARAQGFVVFGFEFGGEIFARFFKGGHGGDQRRVHFFAFGEFVVLVVLALVVFVGFADFFF